MNNYKIKVNTPEESKEAQELFKAIGYGKGACSLGSYPTIIVTIQDWATGDYCSTRALGLDIPTHENYKEITLPQLKDMVVLKRNDVKDATHTDQDDWMWYVSSNGDGYVWQCGNPQQIKQWDKASLDLVDLKPIEKTMKEYLVKTKEGEYHYINDSYDTCPAYVEKIEIPEGAEIAVICGKFISFWKNGATFFIGSDTEWDYKYELDCSTYLRYSTNGGAKIIWQRATHPEELPFIDDEPKSINDQYAEIEQVRQQSINETLVERQSSYGCYEDVAHVTQEILKALRSSGGYDRMPAPHKESMHMIASKMARLVCGDHNHKDSWHDIGGYAKLIENLID